VRPMMSLTGPPRSRQTSQALPLEPSERGRDRRCLLGVRPPEAARSVEWTITGAMPRAVPFFFQAEDGIRARNVTGVQTCALPISREVFARAGAPARFRVGSIVKDGRRGRPRPRGKEPLR